MHSNLTDIVELHDQILGDLHRVVPSSEYAGVPPMGFSYSSPTSRIQRGRSLDVVPEDKTEGLQLYGFSGLAAEPHTAAAAANIFTKIVRLTTRTLSFRVLFSLQETNPLNRRAASLFTKSTVQSTEW